MTHPDDDDMVAFMDEYLRSYQYNNPNYTDITTIGGGVHRMILDQGSVTAELSFDSLKKLVVLHKTKVEEAKIRSKNAAVQHAYEQYQILLAMAQ